MCFCIRYGILLEKDNWENKDENTGCDGKLYGRKDISAEHGLCIYVETKEHKLLVDRTIKSNLEKCKSTWN